MSNSVALNSKVAVMCLGDNDSLNLEERTQLATYNIGITFKKLTVEELGVVETPTRAEDFDDICYSVLSLPTDQCPSEKFEEICMKAIVAKFDKVQRAPAPLKKIWRQIVNRLVYSFAVVVTCGDQPFEDKDLPVVDAILDGICYAFADDKAICKEENIETVTCHSFDQSFVRSILRIINNIEYKMSENEIFWDLYDKLDVAVSLIECASTDFIEEDSGTEVHSEGKSVAIVRLKKLVENYQTQVTHSNTADTSRRALATASNSCSVKFDKVPDNLKDKEGLVIKVEYDKDCVGHKKEMCDATLALKENPGCCKINVETTTRDYSGAIKVNKVEVATSQNGKATLNVPKNTCSSSTQCMFYDETKNCWDTKGVTTAEGCATCATDHFSVFSMVGFQPKPKSNGKLFISYYRVLILLLFL